MTTPTAPPISDAERILARSVPITLADGTTAHLRYGMAALIALEEKFGSLGAVAQALTELDESKPMLGPIMDLLVPALDGYTRETLLGRDLLDTARLGEYGQAAGQAFTLAFPAAAKGADADPSLTAQAATTGPPPGPTGTTSAP